MSNQRRIIIILCFVLVRMTAQPVLLKRRLKSSYSVLSKLYLLLRFVIDIQFISHNGIHGFGVKLVALYVILSYLGLSVQTCYFGQSFPCLFVFLVGVVEFGALWEEANQQNNQTC